MIAKIINARAAERVHAASDLCKSNLKQNLREIQKRKKKLVEW